VTTRTWRVNMPAALGPVPALPEQRLRAAGTSPRPGRSGETGMRTICSAAFV